MIKTDGNKATVLLDHYGTGQIETTVHAVDRIELLVVEDSFNTGAVILNRVEAREIAMVFGQAAGMVCANCKHYDVVPVGQRAQREEEHGACSSAKFVRSYSAVFGDDGVNAPVASNGVLVESGLYVGPNFGCIHFEHKETA